MTILQSPRRMQLFNVSDAFATFARGLNPICWLPLTETAGNIADNAMYTAGPSADLFGGEGAFAAVGGWTIAATPPWSIGSGVASYDDSLDSYIRHNVASAVTRGDTLRFRFDIAITAGNAQLQFRDHTTDNGLFALTNYANGAHDVQRISDSAVATTLRVRGHPNSSNPFTLDNLVINKVGELDGAIAGTTTPGQPGLRGGNHAYLLDGATSLLTIYNRASLQGLTDFSLWALFNPSSAGENDSGTLFSKSGEFEVRFNSSSRDLIATVHYDTTNAQVVTSTTLSANQWHSVGLRIANSGKAIDLFVDGVEASYASEQTGVGSRVSNTNNLIVGNNTAINQTLAGLLDEALIVGRPLTNNEFALLHRLA